MRFRCRNVASPRRSENTVFNDIIRFIRATVRFSRDNGAESYRSGHRLATMLHSLRALRALRPSFARLIVLVASRRQTDRFFLPATPTGFPARYNFYRRFPCYKKKLASGGTFFQLRSVFSGSFAEVSL